MPANPTAAELAARLRAACVGNPDAKIPWPHRLLHEAADFLESAPTALREQADLEQLQEQVEAEIIYFEGQSNSKVERIRLANAIEDIFDAFSAPAASPTGEGVHINAGGQPLDPEVEADILRVAGQIRAGFLAHKSAPAVTREQVEACIDSVDRPRSGGWVSALELKVKLAALFFAPASEPTEAAADRGGKPSATAGFSAKWHDGETEWPDHLTRALCQFRYPDNDRWLLGVCKFEGKEFARDWWFAGVSVYVKRWAYLAAVEQMLTASPAPSPSADVERLKAESERYKKSNLDFLDLWNHIDRILDSTDYVSRMNQLEAIRTAMHDKSVECESEKEMNEALQQSAILASRVVEMKEISTTAMRGHEQALDRVVELEQTIEAQNAKLKSLAPHGTCGCSLDSPDELCLHHSPQLAALQAECERLKGYLKESERQFQRAIDDGHALLTEKCDAYAQLSAASQYERKAKAWDELRKRVKYSLENTNGLSEEWRTGYADAIRHVLESMDSLLAPPADAGEPGEQPPESFGRGYGPPRPTCPRLLATYLDDMDRETEYRKWYVHWCNGKWRPVEGGCIACDKRSVELYDVDRDASDAEAVCLYDADLAAEKPEDGR